jgi:saccharopine dehydrogenase-like NADP-dependent oxidoreductase
MKIALLGAGHIGQTIARLLSASGDYTVTVADQSREALAKLDQIGVATRLVETQSDASIDGVLKGQDAVINALPYHLALTIAQAAKRVGCHYFDLTEDVAATKGIMALAKDANTAFMPQCGLAPGFIGIAAYHLAKAFDSIDEIKMRVGALPAFPTNSLKYNLTWSVDGLINEYCHPCEAIANGKMVSLMPLEGLEHFSLDGVEYEAFNTSGGLGTLCDTLAGKVRNLDYKSVRYPGHRELMQFLLSDLRLSNNQEALKEILRMAVPTTMQDVVLVFITVSGFKNGAFVQDVFARKVFAKRSTATEGALSAIQITTAAGICAAVDLFREGKLPKAGFVPQEKIALPDFLNNRFGKAYEESRRIESIS